MSVEGHKILGVGARIVAFPYRCNILKKLAT